jgi:hypothetical protein
MQGVGRAGVLSYFKRPTTKQMRCPVKAYDLCVFFTKKTYTTVSLVNKTVIVIGYHSA